jgi:enhancer of polycomb-like protein
MTVIEYNLDNEDEDWLEKYNNGQNRLPAEKLEVMLYKLVRPCIVDR